MRSTSWRQGRSVLQRKKPDCLVEVFDDKTDMNEGGDAGRMAVH
jgi:hypothetical protein